MVGRASIKEGHLLRSLLVQEPWTEESADLMGPLAKDECLQEQSSPPLDKMPSISTQSIKLVGELVSSVPYPPADFSENEWGKIAQMGDALISSVGSLKDAAHCYIAKWREKRSPTAMTPQGIQIFKKHVEPGLFDKALQISKQGVNPLSHSPPITSPQQPYPSVRDNPQQTIHDLRPDLIEGRLFLFSTRSEDKLGPLMETKLSFVEQKDVGGTGAKIRYICDPRVEINSRADSRRHPFLFVPTIPSLLRRILFWKRRYPKIPVLLCKRDVKSAFKLIPLSIRMLYHTGLRISDYLLVYLSMYFGWKGAPGNWGIISSLLMQYVASHVPKNAHTHGPESFEASQFVDDGGVAEPALGLRPWMSVKLWEVGLCESLGEKGLNKDKKRIEGKYTTQALMWGINVDTKREIVSLPEDKILKAQLLLANPLFDSGVTRLPLNLIQKLRGKMEFWSCCCHHIKTECPAVDKMLSSKNGYSFPRGNSSLAKKAFAEFWESVEFLRILLGSSEDVTASFNSSFPNVLTLPEQLSFQETRQKIVWIGPDATMDRCGAIDFTHKFYTYFPTSSIPRIDTHTEECEDDFIISISEFCSFIFFILMRGKALRGKLIAYTGDNSNVITWFPSRKAGNEWGRFLLRILALYEHSMECRTYPLYISTFNNTECDTLTRLPRNEIETYDKGKKWIFVNPEDIFKFYLTESFIRRIPTIPFDSNNMIAYIYQLAEKRTYRPIPHLGGINFPIVVIGKGSGCWDRLLGNSWANQGYVLKWPPEPDFIPELPNPLLEDIKIPPQGFGFFATSFTVRLGLCA